MAEMNMDMYDVVVLPPQNSKRFMAICLFLATLGMIGLLLYYWKDLTPCFQRQALAIIVTLVYWQLKGDDLLSFIIEILQVFMIFALIQKINTKESKTLKECLDPSSFARKLIYSIYITLFSYYLTMISILGFLSVLHICSQWSNSSLTTRQGCIRGREFEALEKVKFSHSEMAKINAQTSCSICLSEFEEQEEVVKLPICNHCFHKECIKQWLETQIICPYCRSDIKINFERKREEMTILDRQGNQNNNPSSSVENNIEINQSFSQITESRQMAEMDR